ncbi:hypothetical protein [Mucilaginibacter ginsenosidivorax]|uniref:Uncharacterized protein n=1 Tax=Mucilaginibacter ginsenosidivorax TaxID=862126 RepID=A0A5B8W3G8_9SPHI|nr:hypothetical protein [Mucilaginibacter ginsenosidivorax]QEC78610.1 hypothetical protein FSB76_22660 [Mucilaginibacter ginsenosidivorax]
MKKVSSSSVGKSAGFGEFTTQNKPSLTETVTKYGGVVRDSDNSKNNGSLSFRESTTVGNAASGKSLNKQDIYYQGKILGSKG